MKLAFPNSIFSEVYKCTICNKVILSECAEMDDRGICIRFTPASRYWNVQREEVYCSAEHSLERHNQL